MACSHKSVTFCQQLLCLGPHCILAGLLVKHHVGLYASKYKIDFVAIGTIDTLHDVTQQFVHLSTLCPSGLHAVPALGLF